MHQELDGGGRSTRQACRALNRLIVANKEDVLADEDAVRAVRDPGFGEHLRQQAHQHAAFIDDLRHAVVALGGRPATQPSSIAWARSILRHLRALVGGWHEGDAYAAIADAERRTAKLYVDALSGALPDDARFGVKRQLAQIEIDHEDARKMRSLH